MYPQLSTDQFAVVQRQSGPEWSPDPVNDFNPWACVDQNLKIWNQKLKSFLVFQNDLRQGIVLHLIRLVLFGLFQVNTEKSVFLGKLPKFRQKKLNLRRLGNGLVRLLHLWLDVLSDALVLLLLRDVRLGHQFQLFDLKTDWMKFSQTKEQTWYSAWSSK